MQKQAWADLKPHGQNVAVPFGPTKGKFPVALAL